MHIQVVNFHLRDLSDADYRSACDGWAPAFAAVPGLISKVWLADAATNTYGGIYTWTDRAAMEAFASSDLFKAVVGNPKYYRKCGSNLPRCTSIIRSIPAPDASPHFAVHFASRMRFR